MECSLVQELKSLIQEVCRTDSQDNGSWSDLLEKLLILSGNVSSEIKSTDKTTMEQLESLAVNLWNFAVTLKTGRKLSLLSNAKLRHICLNLIDACVLKDTDQLTLKRKIAIGLKTGRAWLDTKEIGMAVHVLALTDEYIKQLQRLVIENVNKNGPSGTSEKQKLEVDQDIFKLLSYRAETCVAQNDHPTALELIQLAKEMLIKFPNEGAFLSMLCYNFGVELYQQKGFKEAVTWLKESFELGKHQTNLESRNQARTLRLLASVYLEWDQEEYIQKALNAVSLANNEYTHPAGLSLYLRVLLKANEPQSVILKAVKDIMQQPGVTIDVGINTALLLSKSERHELAVELMKELMKKFEHSSNVGELLMANFDILLASQDKGSLKDFVEYCIVEYNSNRRLDPTVKKRFHIEFWSQAYIADENKNYKEALDWYNYSLSLFSKEESGSQNLARLHRNRATCYLNLNQMERATEVLNDVKKYDPSSINTQFLMFKLALAGSNIEEGMGILHQMCSDAAKIEDKDKEVDANKIICQAAYMAYEDHRESTAALALECLANCSSDCVQVLTALRCLIRLKLSDVDQDKNKRLCGKESLHTVSEYPQFWDHEICETAYNKLLQAKDKERKLSVERTSDASWFMRVAWNLALKCEDSPSTMKSLFVLCSQFSPLCPSDEENTLMRQKTCLLMAAAACLQEARTGNESHKTNMLEEAVHHIHECKLLNEEIQHEMDLDSSIECRQRDTSDLLLLMYEFEARCKLQDPTVEEIIDLLLRIPNPDPKPFETIAGLSMEASVQNKSISVRALKIAIRKHMQIPTTNYDRVSKLFRGLVHLAFSSQTDNTREEAWALYQEILDILEKRAQGEYPEMEILWLMIKAWNCGITFFSSGRLTFAEKWCSHGMKFLKHLSPGMLANYNERMTNTYAEILEQMDQSKYKKGLGE